MPQPGRAGVAFSVSRSGHAWIGRLCHLSAVSGGTPSSPGWLMLKGAPAAYSRTLLHEWYQASPAADASQSETRLLLWRHCWLNNTGLAVQCDMNSLTSVLNFKSKNKMRRRSVEMLQVAIAAVCLTCFPFWLKTDTFIANMKTLARGARTHNLPKSRQTRYLLRHIAAESNVLKDDNNETPRGSLNIRIACLPIHLFRCVDERQVYIQPKL